MMHASHGGVREEGRAPAAPLETGSFKQADVLASLLVRGKWKREETSKRAGRLANASAGGLVCEKSVQKR